MFTNCAPASPATRSHSRRVNAMGLHESATTLMPISEVVRGHAVRKSITLALHVDRAHLPQPLLDRIDPDVSRAEMSGKQPTQC